MIHSKKRNRLTQSRLNDLVYVKYNRALIQRFNLRDKIDPIALKDIDDSNEWLTGKTPGQAQDEYVFEEDEGLTWGHVVAVTGVHEERFNLKSRGNTQEESTQGGRDGSSRESIRQADGDEDEEDDEGYQSLDEDDMVTNLTGEDNYI
ncbi:hypothetical protein V6N13_091173 [Hibiscus sabdariffa]